MSRNHGAATGLKFGDMLHKFSQSNAEVWVKKFGLNSLLVKSVKLLFPLTKATAKQVLKVWAEQSLRLLSLVPGGCSEMPARWREFHFALQRSKSCDEVAQCTKVDSDTSSLFFINSMTMQVRLQKNSLELVKSATDHRRSRLSANRISVSLALAFLTIT